MGHVDRVLGGSEVRTYRGKPALRALHPILVNAGLTPLPRLGMEPLLLAEGYEGDEPEALVAFDGGRPVAYLPYILRPGRMAFGVRDYHLLGFPYRQLRVLGYHGSGNAEIGMAARLLDQLRMVRDWDVADLYELPTSHALFRAVDEATSRSGCIFYSSTYIYETYVIDLDVDFETYLIRHFSSKSRYNLRRTLRKLDDFAPGRVRVRSFSRPDEVDEFLEQAEGIARRTYQWQIGPCATLVVTPALREKLAALARQGFWRGYLLIVGDKPGAYCHGMVHGGTYFYNTVGFAPELAPLSPGQVLLLRMIEDLCATGAARRLDLGTRAANYKEFFCTTRPRLFDAHLHRKQLYPLALLALQSTWSRGRRVARRLLSGRQPDTSAKTAGPSTSPPHNAPVRDADAYTESTL
jgi:hypothetical protein